MNNKSIMDTYVSSNNELLNKFNSFLLSKQFLSKKNELEKIELSTTLTIRIFSSKTHKRKYIRRLLNDASQPTTLSSILTKHTSRIIKTIPSDTTLLITNYIEEKRNNNIIEENMLYTNYNLENYTGEDVEDENTYTSSYNRDVKEAKEYKYNKMRCNEKYFSCEFKMLDLLGYNSGVLFGEHIKSIWKNNKDTNKLDGYITYILKLIETLDYFSNSLSSNINYTNILTNNITRIMSSDDDIKSYLGNIHLSLGFNSNNKYNNTILEKYSRILITICSLLITLNKTEYSPNHNIINDCKKYEEKLLKHLNKIIKDIKSKTDILHSNKDYEMYFVFLYLHEIINVKHYCRDEKYNILSNKTNKYIKMCDLYHRNNISKLTKIELKDYFSINDLQKIYMKFISKDLSFKCV